MVLTVLIILVTAVCIYTDLRRGRIYNAVVGPAIVAGLGYHLYASGAGGLWFGLKGWSLDWLCWSFPSCSAAWGEATSSFSRR
ncbi:MAG: hypothetical protein ACUVRC_07495 [Desulfotomaculales bacterium]